jgi:hypothetical protein
MLHRITGVDVHNKNLAAVITDRGGRGEYEVDRRLAEWLVTREVEEVVTASTTQYWRPVWETLKSTERRAPCARGRWRYIGHAASGAGAIESRSAWAKAGFPGRRTAGEASGSKSSNSDEIRLGAWW